MGGSVSLGDHVPDSNPGSIGHADGAADSLEIAGAAPPSPAVTRSVVALRLILDEAEGRAHAAAGYADRVVAVALMGVAIESAIRLVTGPATTEAMIPKGIRGVATGKLSNSRRSAAMRAWQHRIGVQHHGGEPPGERECAELCDGVRGFVRDALSAELHVDIESAAIASILKLAPLRDALSIAEQALATGDDLKSAEWLSRSYRRLKAYVAYAHRRARWTADDVRGMLERATQDAGLVDEIDTLYLAAVLRITPLELTRLRQELPHTWGMGVERETTNVTLPVVSNDRLRRHFTTLLNGALSLDEFGGLDEAAFAVPREIALNVDGKRVSGEDELPTEPEAPPQAPLPPRAASSA